MSFNILLATPQHLAEVAKLFDQYRQFYQQRADPAAAQAFIEARLRQGDAHILLASDERGEGLGFTQLYPAFSSVAMRPLWVLNDLFVAPYARRLGVARGLLDGAKTLASKHKVGTIKLATAVDNHQAKALYLDMGYTKVTAFDHYTLKLD